MSSKGQIIKDHQQNIKDATKPSDDFEVGVGMEELMGLINEPFKQNMFTQRFEDQSLEEEFQKWLHPTIIQCGRVFIWELLAMMILLIVVQVMRLIKLDGNYPTFQWVIFSICVSVLLAVVLYLLSRKYMKISLQFSNIGSLVLTIAAIEIEMQTNAIYQDGGVCAMIIALLGLISMLSYCQLSLLLSYILSIAYTSLRIYHFGDLGYAYIRFLMFWASAYSMIYVFSRFFHQRERDKFKTCQQQKNLLKLFHNLIKLFHDGIIITQDENVVFYNKQISSLFNINIDTRMDLEENSDSGKATDQDDRTCIKEKKKQIVESLKSSCVKQDNQMRQPLSVEACLQRPQHHNIWEFIQDHQLNNQGMNEGVGNGTYFKFKRGGMPEEKRKLQAFSQLIQSGNKQLVMTSIREMSLWIELEKQKNLTNMKTIAFASAAHEFRNPLNAINSSLQLLESSVIKPADLLYFNTAKNCSKLMLNLIKDILDFSQLEAKSLMLNFSEVHIMNLLEDCLSMFLFKAEQKGIDLYIMDKENIPEYQYTDEGRLQQILINLISNSMKYTTQGYVRISAVADQESSQLKIIVEDSGVGMDQEQQLKLFQYFMKSTSNRHLNKEGVGLGLTISMNLAKALGGDIEVKSQMEKGSTFILRLPIIKNHLRSPQRVSSQNVSMLLQCSQNQSFNCLLEEKDSFFENKLYKRNLVIDVCKNLTLHNRRSSQYSQMAEDETQRNMIKAEQIELKTETNCNCSQILIVDDEPFNLIIQQGMLQSYNIDKADIAYNGQEALKKIEENSQMSCTGHQPYKLITLDNCMPLMNGFQTAEIIRLRQKENLIDSNLKIAMISGDEHILQDQQYQEVFDFILLKPIERKQFKAILSIFNPREVK